MAGAATYSRLPKTPELAHEMTKFCPVLGHIAPMLPDRAALKVSSTVPGRCLLDLHPGASSLCFC